MVTWVIRRNVLKFCGVALVPVVVGFAMAQTPQKKQGPPPRPANPPLVRPTPPSPQPGPAPGPVNPMVGHKGPMVLPPQEPGRPVRAAAPRAFGNVITTTSPQTLIPSNYNTNLNLPLTPYIGVGQALALLQTMYLASLGLGYPGYNPVENFPLTPYVGVGQAASIMRLLAPFQPMATPFGFPGFMSPQMLAGGFPFAGQGFGGSGGFGTMASGSGGMSTPSTGGGQGASGMQAQPSLSTYGGMEQSLPQSALVSMLNHLAGFDWPLGLRVLEPEEKTKELRQEIDDAVRTMLVQQGGPSASPDLLASVAKKLNQLSRLYNANAHDMALTRQQEEDVKRFLDNAGNALAVEADKARILAALLNARSSQAKDSANYGQPQQGGGQGTPAPAGTSPAQPAAPTAPTMPQTQQANPPATRQSNAQPQTQPQPQPQPQPKPQPKPQPQPKPPVKANPPAEKK